jgi:hypothetical protein
MEVSGELHAPAALTAGKKSPILIGEQAGWALELEAEINLNIKKLRHKEPSLYLCCQIIQMKSKFFLTSVFV